MPLADLLIKELDREAAATRKLLQCIPDGHEDWKPHAKSFPLARLGSHVAELPGFMVWIVSQDELDMSTLAGSRVHHNNSADMVQMFDERIAKAKSALEGATDEHLMQPWTFRSGEHILAQDSRYESLRAWMINHMIHHRGQLSVYLRLLDIPIPGMYGPSADDIIARQAAMAAAS